MSYDLGDVATLGITIKDSTGVAANAGAVVCTITLPDGTTTTPSVTNSPTGSYQIAYTPTQIGLHGIRWVATGANAGAVTDSFEVSDPAYLPFVSLADAKDHLQNPGGVGSTAYDEKIRRMVVTATTMAENYTNRPLSRRTVVQTLSGGITAIMLYTPSVLSITSVTENGNTLAVTDYIADLATGVLYRGSTISPTYWSTGLKNIVVTYVAGIASPPADLQFGVLEILRWLWSNTQESNRPSRSSSTDQGVLSDALPNWLMRPLDSYCMPTLG